MTCTLLLKYNQTQKPTNYHSHRKIAVKPYKRKEALWIDYKDPNQKEDNTPFRFTGKERDLETGLYYYGARYLDPKTSRWMSADPAMYKGDYIPSAPVDDEARKRNGNLPGQGGIYNYVNMHVYHYAGNNPVKLVDPDGRNFYNQTEYDIIVIPEHGPGVIVGSGKMYKGRIDGARLPDGTYLKINDFCMIAMDGEDRAFAIGELNISLDILKDINNFINDSDDLLSGVYRPGTELYEHLDSSWGSRVLEENLILNSDKVFDMTIADGAFILLNNLYELEER